MEVAIKCVNAWAISAEIPWLDIILHWPNSVCVCVWAQTITIKLNECTLWEGAHTFRYMRKDSRTKTNRKCLWRRCFLWFFSIFFASLCVHPFYSVAIASVRFSLFNRLLFLIFTWFAECHSSLFSHFKDIFICACVSLGAFCCRVNRRPKRWVNGNNTFGFR